MTPAPFDVEAWAAAVRFTVDEPVARELLDRPQPPMGVWVTDLLDLRRAFWRRRFDVAPPEARRARMIEGRRLHRRLARLSASADQREVRVYRDGLVGQVDLVQEVPVEIKTTGRPLRLEELLDRRETYVDQLAAYCALLGRPAGRLVVVYRTEGSPQLGVLVVECEFDALDQTLVEMKRRAEALRTAWGSGGAGALPACPWRGRGCEFEQARVCDCRGTEREATPLVPAESLRATLDPWASERFVELLRTEGTETERAGRFRELLYPRRAYFERIAPEGEEAPPTPVVDRGPPQVDLYRELSDRLESGPTGELTRRVPPNGEVEEAVPCFREDPFLVKISRAARPPDLDSLVRAQPQYFLDLGLRCAAIGRDSGWLFLGRERATSSGERLTVLRVGFQPLEAFRDQLSRRATELQRAIRERSPVGLPACPSWMVEGCPYRSVCGCATDAPEPARSQR